jgi:hypothetical protein
MKEYEKKTEKEREMENEKYQKKEVEIFVG